MKKILSKSLDNTRSIARAWLASLGQKENIFDGKVGQALVVGLSGNLGSGKTAFVKAVAEELGISENVTSPTFVIEKIYTIGSKNGIGTIDSSGSNGGIEPQASYRDDISIKNFPFNRLVHIDAYRLESPRELEILNFEELVEDPNNLILIEWPENVREILPEGALAINCEFVSEGEREYGFDEV